MRITRLRIQDIKRHRVLELHPHPGLTVIRGPNEAGKSTVQQAIELVLFRRANSTAQEVVDARSWDADPGADPRIELDFDQDGMLGRLVKVFAGSRGSVSLELNGQSESDPGRVDASIAELTGLASDKFLRSTASVRHQELEDLDKDEGALRDRLQQSMSGADQGTWSARRKLEDAIRRYRTEGSRNPGLLKVARDDLEQQRQALVQQEDALSRLEADRAAYAAAHERRVALDAQGARDQAAVEQAENAVRLHAGLADAQKRYERYRKAAELREQLETAERTRPSRLPLPELRAGMDKLKNLEFLLMELSSDVEAEPDLGEYEFEPPVLPRWKPFAVLAALLALAAIAAVATGVLLPEVGVMIGAGGAALLAAAAAVSGYWAWRKRRHANAVRIQAELQGSEIERRLRGRSTEQTRLRATRRERDELLTRMGIRDVAAGEALLEQEIEQTVRMEGIISELRGVLGDEPIDTDAGSLRDQAAAEIEQTRHALAGMGLDGADPTGTRLAAQNALRATQLAGSEALREEGQAQGRVEQNAVDAEQVAALSERIAVREEQVAAMERRVRIYEATLAGINEAEQATMKKAARYLEQHMAADVATITGGRYRRVRVDEQDLALTVWSPERGDWVPSTSLSRGTVDQLYLAARLGLVRQVTQERRPPLILDDPFVTFDDDRALRGLELLKQLAADHQVLYLTTSDRYDSLADQVVELTGPTRLDDQVGLPPEPPVSARPVQALPSVAPEPDPLAGSEPSSEPALSPDPVAGAEPSSDRDPQPEPEPVAELPVAAAIASTPPPHGAGVAASSPPAADLPEATTAPIPWPEADLSLRPSRARGGAG
jgi:recombinational DNA repair ATPase RecF